MISQQHRQNLSRRLRRHRLRYARRADSIRNRPDNRRSRTTGSHHAWHNGLLHGRSVRALAGKVHNGGAADGLRRRGDARNLKHCRQLSPPSSGSGKTHPAAGHQLRQGARNGRGRDLRWGRRGGLARGRGEEGKDSEDRKEQLHGGDFSFRCLIPGEQNVAIRFLRLAIQEVTEHLVPLIRSVLFILGRLSHGKIIYFCQLEISASAPKA